LLLAVLDCPFKPAVARNNHSSFPEHVPKITAGQSLLHPRIDPRLALRRGFIRSSVAPDEMFILELSCQHMEQQGRATRAKVVLGDRITTQPIGLSNFGIKRPRVVPTCFGLFYAAAHLDVLSNCQLSIACCLSSPPRHAINLRNELRCSSPRRDVHISRHAPPLEGFIGQRKA